MMMPNATAGMISIRFGFTGPALCISTACAAGANAIGEGVRMVRDGSADVVVAGGTEAPVTPLTVSAFARMGAMSTRNDDPERASRPFDAARDGFVIAEGAGFTRARDARSTRSRAAPRSTARSLGYGRNADAYHITAPVARRRGRGRVHAARARRRRPRRRRRSATSTRTARRRRSTTPPRPRRSARCSATRRRRSRRPRA